MKLDTSDFPESEGAVRSLYARTFLRDLDVITPELVGEVKAHLPEYRYLIDTLRDQDFERNLRKHLLRFIDNVVSGSQVRHFGEQHMGYGTALRRAQQGFPMDSILRTYQFATRAVWNWTVNAPELGEVRARAMAICWPQWLDYVDAAVSATSLAYSTLR